MLRRTMLVGLASFTVLGACSSSGGDSEKPSSRASQRDLAEAVARQPDFSLLQKWIEAADYTARLKRRGPYTLFAPSDNAMRDIRPTVRTRLMRDEDPELLRAILDHHVVAGRVSLSDMRRQRALRTIDGAEVKITRQGGSLRFGTGNLVGTDIEASNGIIHVIDQVQLPPHLPEGPV